MKKALLFSTLTILGVSLLAGCGKEQTPDEPVNPDVPLPPIPEVVPTLSDKMKELVKADDVTVTLAGKGKTTAHGAGGNRTDNEGSVNRTITFTKDIYYFEEAFNETLNSTDYVVEYIGGGYANKNDKINAFSVIADEFKSEGVISEKFKTYQEAIYTFDDLNLTNLKDFEENTYNFDLTVAPFIDAPNNPIDYQNFEILCEIFKFGNRKDVIDAMSISYDEFAKELAVNFTTNYRESSLVFKGEYKAVIEVGKDNLEGIVDYVKLSDFEEPAENEGFNRAQDLLDSGYMIDDYPVQMSSGEVLKGKIYSTKDYYVLDYTQEAAELLQGFFVRDGSVYSIGLTNDGNLTTQEAFTPDDIKVLNETSTTQITAGDLCNLMGAMQTGTIPIYASFAGRKGSRYVTELESRSPDIKIYEVNDYGGVLGIPGELESLVPITLMYPGFTPLGYTLIHDTKKNVINIGWQAYGDLSGNVGVFGVGDMMTISNFGTTHKTMEKLIKLHQN